MILPTSLHQPDLPVLDILTCAHASHIHQPQFGDSWQDHNNSVSLLQSAYFSQHIGHFPRQEPQLLKAPLHFISFSIYPPKGRVWRSLSNLQNIGIQTPNFFFWRTMKSQCRSICKLWKIQVFHNRHISYYFSLVLKRSTFVIDQAQIFPNKFSFSEPEIFTSPTVSRLKSYSGSYFSLSLMLSINASTKHNTDIELWNSVKQREHRQRTK